MSADTDAASDLHAIREEYAYLYGKHSVDPRSTAYFTAGSFISEVKMIRKALGNVEGKQVLDVGCGPGILTQHIAKRNTVIGIDIVSEFLKQAAQREIRPATASASQLPFRNGQFDIVIVSGIVPCMKDLAPLIGDVCRVAKPGGYVYISNLNTRSVIRKLFWLFYTEKYTVILHDPDEISELLEAQGVRDIEVSYNFYPFPVVLKQKERSLLCDVGATGYALVGRAG